VPLPIATTVSGHEELFIAYLSRPDHVGRRLHAAVRRLRHRGRQALPSSDPDGPRPM
jgi:hypothetical protein